MLLPVSAVSAFPRPHWLQGRVFGSRGEPTYRSHNLRVAWGSLDDVDTLLAAGRMAYMNGGALVIDGGYTVA